jgi:hypothetical protein
MPPEAGGFYVKTRLGAFYRLSFHDGPRFEAVMNACMLVA